MLLSAKDQGLGRRRPRSYSHNHVYALPKMARSSKSSLLSTTTTQSSGSNGSSSTVTQESYNKSKDESSKKRKPARRKKETLRPQSPSMEAVQETSDVEPQTEKLDVFDFLIDEEPVEGDEDATKQVSLIQDEPLNEGEPDVFEALPSDTASPSDSGISMDDKSCVLEQTIPTPVLPEIATESAPACHIFLEQLRTRSSLAWPEIPRARSTVQSPTYAQVHVEELPHLAGSYPEQITASSIPFRAPSDSVCHNSTPDACDAIAAKLDWAGRNGRDVPFRSFQQCNYRLLIHLQDDIADLENELDHLDKLVCDEQAPDRSNSSCRDSGRRPTWHHDQYRMSMKAKEADLIAKLDDKLERYCKQSTRQISSRWADHQL